MIQRSLLLDNDEGVGVTYLHPPAPLRSATNTFIIQWSTVMAGECLSCCRAEDSQCLLERYEEMAAIWQTLQLSSAISMLVKWLDCPVMSQHLWMNLQIGSVTLVVEPMMVRSAQLNVLYPHGIIGARHGFGAERVCRCGVNSCVMVKRKKMFAWTPRAIKHDDKELLPAEYKTTATRTLTTTTAAKSSPTRERNALLASCSKIRRARDRATAL
jgi:hypothetical protein